MNRVKLSNGVIAWWDVVSTGPGSTLHCSNQRDDPPYGAEKYVVYSPHAWDSYELIIDTSKVVDITAAIRDARKELH